MTLYQKIIVFCRIYTEIEKKGEETEHLFITCIILYAFNDEQSRRTSLIVIIIIIIIIIIIGISYVRIALMMLTPPPPALFLIRIQKVQ